MNRSFLKTALPCIRLLALLWNLVAANAVLWIEFGTNTESALGECLPDLTLVGCLGEVLVGVEDGVTGLNEVGVAGLAKIKQVSSVI